MEKMRTGLRGQLTIELFDEQGNKIYEETKKNKIVNEAHELVGLVMGNPGKRITVKESELFTVSDINQQIRLKHAPVRNKQMKVELGVTESREIITIDLESGEELLQITSVSFVPRTAGPALPKERYTDYTEGKPAEKKIVLSPAAMGATVKEVLIEYQVKLPIMTEIVPFSETVKAGMGGVVEELQAGKNALGSTYKIDYETGLIEFAAERSNIEVKYEYTIPYGVNFMALGRKPDGPSGPISFGEAARLYNTMMESGGKRHEFSSSRQLIPFPRTAEKATDESQLFQVKANTATDKTSYKINLFEGPVLAIEKLVYKKVGEINPVTEIPAQKGFGSADRVKIQSIQTGEIQLADTLYTEMQPASEFQVYFKINAGASVLYTATFPKGVPGPEEQEFSEVLDNANAQTGVIQLTMQKEMNSLVSVTKSQGTTPPVDIKTHCSIDSAEKNKMNIVPAAGLAAGDKVSVTYKFMNATAEIYQVAMFSHPSEEDHLNPLGKNPPPKMFNISGVGPIFKDPNTEMVVTWSVTY